MSLVEERAHNRAHWEDMAPRWKAWWGQYKPASQPVSEKLLAFSGITQGQRVLDLATGMGEPALSFAREVGPDGFVLAIDQSPQMIAWAREEATAAGLNNLRFDVQDAESLDLGVEPPFDALVSRWGLMFCLDPVATLQNAKRWLRPGGHLAAAVWCPPEDVPMIDLATRVLERELGIVLPRSGPGPFTLSDSAYLASLIQNAGFEMVASEKVAVLLPFASAQAFLNERIALMPPLAEALKGLSQVERQQYDQALELAVEPWRSDSGVNLANWAYCISARAVIA
ncbi:MAG: class I SAM-dependent methyltransferase [Candidatus Sericytochromatia bacterium]